MALFQLSILLIIGFGSPCLAWTFTHYAEVFMSPGPFIGTDGYASETTTPVTHRVTPTVDNPVPISSYTSVYEKNSEIFFETILLEPGQGEKITSNYFTTEYTQWMYSVIMTYTRLPECPGPASSSITAGMNLPTDVNDVITPFSTTWTASSSSDYYLDGLATETSVTAYFEETQIPETVIGTYRRELYMPEIYYRCESNYYFGDGNYANCEDHPYKLGDTIIGGKYQCSNGTFYYGMQPYQIVLIFLGGWMLLVFAMGIFQSIWRFRDLMTGNPASRGMPAPFVCLVPILTIPLMLFHHHGFEARSDEDRELLTVQWRTTPFREKVRLWLKYGFTRDYPPMLGTPPVPLQRRPQSMAGHVQEEPYEAPPPPYTRNATPPPPHPDIEQNPRNLTAGPGPALSRFESPPKYESDNDRM